MYLRIYGKGTRVFIIIFLCCAIEHHSKNHKLNDFFIFSFVEYDRYQPNIRLPSVDVKVSICETLLMALTRLEAWQRLDDIRGTLAQLVALENSLENAKVSLARKLGMPRSRSEHSLPHDEPEIYRKETQARKHQVSDAFLPFNGVDSGCWNFFAHELLLPSLPIVYHCMGLQVYKISRADECFQLGQKVN